MYTGAYKSVSFWTGRIVVLYFSILNTFFKGALFWDACLYNWTTCNILQIPLQPTCGSFHRSCLTLILVTVLCGLLYWVIWHFACVYRPCICSLFWIVCLWLYIKAAHGSYKPHICIFLTEYFTCPRSNRCWLTPGHIAVQLVKGLTWRLIMPSNFTCSLCRVAGMMAIWKLSFLRGIELHTSGRVGLHEGGCHSLKAHYDGRMRVSPHHQHSSTMNSLTCLR